MSSGRRDVLIVDDDDDLRATLALLLEFEGFAVRCARDGAEALRAITEARPLIVLLDLMMPVMNGWQFRAAMLADPSLADIPVIVITAAGAATRHLPGGERTIVKPFDIEVLLEAIRGLVGA